MLENVHFRFENKTSLMQRKLYKKKIMRYGCISMVKRPVVSGTCIPDSTLRLFCPSILHKLFYSTSVWWDHVQLKCILGFDHSIRSTSTQLIPQKSPLFPKNSLSAIFSGAQTDHLFNNKQCPFVFLSGIPFFLPEVKYFLSPIPPFFRKPPKHKKNSIPSPRINPREM